jgi:hydroxypyruvate reductase
MVSGMNDSLPGRQRTLLLNIYQQLLHAIEGRYCVQHWLAHHALAGPVYTVAIGKAATSMMQGAIEQLGDQLCAGLLITRHGYADNWRNDHRVAVIESGHPVPDEHSLLAGERLLAFVHTAPADAHLLFLISGGTSSLVEILPDGIDAEQLQQANGYLLSAGLGIAGMNAVRRQLSCIKGGRLALHLDGRMATALYISDVPTDDVAMIGSGLLAAETHPTVLPGDLPDWLQACMELAPPLPPETHPAFADICNIIVSDRHQALHAAAAAAGTAGVPAYIHEEFLDGDAVQTAQDLVHMSAELCAGIHLWGTETTVSLPTQPGRGGRCQQLALAAARDLAGAHDRYLLAAATDGTDGNTEDAGALVDGNTIARGQLDELDADECLAQADAGRYLAASGDLLSTGPTGSNVMDIVMLLKVA